MEAKQIPIVLIVLALMIGGFVMAYNEGHDGADTSVTQTYPDYGTGGFYEK